MNKKRVFNIIVTILISILDLAGFGLAGADFAVAIKSFIEKDYPRMVVFLFCGLYMFFWFTQILKKLYKLILEERS